MKNMATEGTRRKIVNRGGTQRSRIPRPGSTPIQGGRPRQTVDLATILHLRNVCDYGWRRVAKEYQRITGKYISRETCKRRYEENQKDR